MMAGKRQTDVGGAVSQIVGVSTGKVGVQDFPEPVQTVRFAEEFQHVLMVPQCRRKNRPHMPVAHKGSRSRPRPVRSLLPLLR